MSWPAHDDINAYLTARIKSTDASATVTTTQATDMAAWLERSTHKGRSYLISYDKPVGRSKGYSIFWHGRNMGGESIMDAIVDAITSESSFTVGGEHHKASIAGGRYLMLDRGFDTYQLEITVHT